MSLPVSREDVVAAHARIAGRVRRTPEWSLPTGAFGHAGGVSLKLELFQHAGSFKTRGVMNTLLAETTLPSLVTAASGGNHGVAVAWGAAQVGVAARVFVPEIASAAKVAAIRAAGAEVVIGGARYADAQEACDRFVEASGALRIHPFDAPRTIAGAGTVALEWAEQAALDTVLVASGGGGLAAGMAAYFRRDVKVVAVEPEGSRALHAAMEAGHPVDVAVESVAADSLGARRAGELVMAIAREAIDRVVLVTDDAIRDAQRALWLGYRIAVEPGGAAATAALLSGAYRPAPQERVGVLLCGGNVDLEKLAATLPPAPTLP